MRGDYHISYTRMTLKYIYRNWKKLYSLIDNVNIFSNDIKRTSDFNKKRHLKYYKKRIRKLAVEI